MISFTVKGSWKKTESALNIMQKLNVIHILHKYGREGVVALSRATPVDTGRAAAAWDYDVQSKGGTYSIIWTNNDMENGFPVVIMLQFGHGTGTGGYVQGQDFINPAMKPVFDKIADDVWKVVTSA